MHVIYGLWRLIVAIGGTAGIVLLVFPWWAQSGSWEEWIVRSVCLGFLILGVSLSLLLAWDAITKWKPDDA